MLSFIKRHVFISGLVVVNIIAIIATIIAIIVSNSKTAVVDIYVTPLNATVSLNGKQYDNFVSHDITPGNYHVKISMEGMQSKEFDISLEKGELVKVQDYLLDANGGFDYYATHRTDALALFDIAKEDDKAAQAFITDYKAKTAILDLLPINYDRYSDDFAFYSQYKIVLDDAGDNCPKVACLIIEDNTGGNEEAAINQIKELGFNPDDYQFSYQFVPIYGGDINE